MSQAARIAFLSIATVVLYSLSIFLSTGVVVFPFPLFDLILFVSVLSFFYVERKTNNEKNFLSPSLLYFLFLALQLGQNVFLGTFLDEKMFVEWMDSDELSLFLLVSEICWLIAVVLWLWNYLEKRIFYIVSFLGCYIISYFDSSTLLIHLLPMLLFFVFFGNNTNLIWRNILLIQGVFNIFSWYMFWIAE